MSDLNHLIERVETATGPDRELDARIIAALLAPVDATVEQSPFNAEWCIYCGTNRAGKPRLWDDRPLGHGAFPTASIDAAVSLAEKVLPGCGWNVERYGLTCDAAIIRIEKHPDERDKEWNAVAPTAPLALVAALLRALSDTKEA